MRRPRSAAHFLLLLALPLAVAVLAPGVRAEMPLPTMGLLGVESASLAQPVEMPAAAPAEEGRGTGTGTGSGGGCTSGLPVEKLKERLHEGGQKRAVVIRGGKFGINPHILAIIRRAANAFAFDPSVKKFLEENLQRQYISDDKEVVAKLTAMGYTVRLLTSADFAGNLAQFKPTVMEELKKKETSVVVFFGHGNTSNFWVLDDRENNVPGLEELVRNKQMKHPNESISADEVKAATADRGGLDALILHGCQNGTTSYHKERAGEKVDGVTFSDCVKKDLGFFAGWVTFSVYLHAQTAPILDRFFCHVSNFDRTRPEATRASSRYFMRSGGIGRMMSEIAFDGDGSGLPLEKLAKDDQIVVHTMDYMSGCEPVKNFIELVHALKFSPASLGKLLREWLVKHYAYCVANRVPMQQEGQGAPPRLSPAATTDEINALLAYHARPILREVLSVVSPGLVFLDKESLRLSDADPDHLFIDLSFSIKNAQEIQRVLDVVRKSQDLVIREKLNSGVGDHLGNQLADRINDTIKKMRDALKDDVADVSIQLSLSKVALKGEDGKPTGKHAIKPWVYRYHIAIGNVPANLKKGGTAPYEIHISMDALDRFVRTSLKNMFPGQIELRYDPGRFSPYLYAYLALRNDMQGRVRAASATSLSTTSTWEFMVNWFNIADGYAYADSRITVAVEPAGDLKIKLTPTISLWLTSGWGILDILPAAKVALSQLASSEATTRLRAEAAKGIDFADFIPADVKNEVVGKVQIKDIAVSRDAVSVYITHK